MCGDRTSIDELETLCENQLADMWLTNPLYNEAFVGETKDELISQSD